MSDMSRAVFRAEIPEIMSALMFGSDGARVKLQCYENGLGEVAKLIGMKGKPLRVTVEVVSDDERKSDYAEALEYGGRLVE